MRPVRDFRPQQLYGVTQRGNQGQWVYRDDQDFRKALDLMGRYAARYGVNIHGWCLMHNHGHWIFEASSEDSISNLMRDMQSGYSRYLNRRYRTQPWKLLAPLTLYGRRARKMFSPYRRAGPVNWTPCFEAMFLDGAGFKLFCGTWRITVRLRAQSPSGMKDPRQEVIGYAWIASERLSLVTGLVEAS